MPREVGARHASEPRPRWPLLRSLGLLVAASCIAGQLPTGAATQQPYVESLSTYHVTLDQVNALVKDIERVINTTTELDEDGVCFYPLLAGFVRLSFHQCASGRCDGCLNMNDPNNRHLELPIAALEAVRRNNVAIDISYGDLWALSGLVASRLAERRANARRSGGPTPYYYMQRVAFRFGREDCPTAPYTSRVNAFPQFSRGFEHVMAYFRQWFGFDEDTVVALMGAHTLGGLRPQQSQRVARQWVAPADLLDNAYYRDLVDRNLYWTRMPAPSSYYAASYDVSSSSSYGGGSRTSPSPQSAAYLWTHRDNKRLMFNTDMCLYKNLSFVSGDQGSVACTYTTCPPSRTAKLVLRYAEDNDYWMTAFAEAYSRMIESGFTAKLREPAAWCTSFPKLFRLCYPQ